MNHESEVVSLHCAVWSRVFCDETSDGFCYLLCPFTIVWQFFKVVKRALISWSCWRCLHRIIQFYQQLWVMSFQVRTGIWSIPEILFPVAISANPMSHVKPFLTRAGLSVKSEVFPNGCFQRPQRQLDFFFFILHTLAAQQQTRHYTPLCSLLGLHACT